MAKQHALEVNPRIPLTSQAKFANYFFLLSNIIILFGSIKLFIWGMAEFSFLSSSVFKGISWLKLVILQHFP